MAFKLALWILYHKESIVLFPSAARMARDMSDKEILKMELDQLKKEVNTPRTAVSVRSWMNVSVQKF